MQLGILIKCTIRLLKLAQLFGNILASEAHSIILQLINDVGVVLLLLNQHFLHLNIVLNSTDVFVLVDVFSRLTVDFAAA